MLLIICYFGLNAAYSFTLIIGSINVSHSIHKYLLQSINFIYIKLLQHQHLKVLSFLIVDGVFTILTVVLLFCTFPSFLVIVLTVVQFYLFYAVFSFWQQLRKEHLTRMELEEGRKRRGEA